MISELFQRVLSIFFTQKCYIEYVTKHNFFDLDCAKATLSKCLGLGIIAGSVTVKVPQIVKITQNQSGQGISMVSVMLDLFAISSNMCYSYIKGFPFSAWGEGMFLAIQTAIIAVLVLHYSSRTTFAAVFVALYSVLLYSLLSGLTPVDLLWSMQVLNVPIIITGKGIQALSNYRNQSTGQLSAATCWMLFLGSSARIFTSVQETGDATIIITYVCATLVNAIIVSQLLYYSKNTKTIKKGKKE